MFITLLYVGGERKSAAASYSGPGATLMNDCSVKVAKKFPDTAGADPDRQSATNRATPGCDRVAQRQSQKSAATDDKSPLHPPGNPNDTPTDLPLVHSAARRTVVGFEALGTVVGAVDIAALPIGPATDAHRTGAARTAIKAIREVREGVRAFGGDVLLADRDRQVDAPNQAVELSLAPFFLGFAARFQRAFDAAPYGIGVGTADKRFAHLFDLRRDGWQSAAASGIASPDGAPATGAPATGAPATRVSAADRASTTRVARRRPCFRRPVFPPPTELPPPVFPPPVLPSEPTALPPQPTDRHTAARQEVTNSPRPRMLMRRL